MDPVKVTVVGDIMCEPLLLKAAKKGKSFDFDGVFAHVKPLFADADLVIGNLEAPLAGKKAGYTDGLYSFNAPDELADAVKRAGISAVLTANNHCMDRGFEGMLRTLRVLDKKRIAHHGTFLSPEARREACYLEARGLRIAVISYTSSDNYSLHRRDMSEEQERLVNFLCERKEKAALADAQRGPLKRVWSVLSRPIKREHICQIKKLLGMKYKFLVVDDYINESTAAPHFARLRADIAEARKNADLVLFCPHTGGQFNIQPGAFSEYTVSKAVEFGAGAVLASHSHIVQKAVFKAGVPCFYSLGNFSMSPNSVFMPHEHLPDYGLAVHLYIEDGKISRTAFSVLKIVETKERPLTVYPADRYMAMPENRGSYQQVLEDVKSLYFAVTGRQAGDSELFEEGGGNCRALKSEFELCGQ